MFLHKFATNIETLDPRHRFGLTMDRSFFVIAVNGQSDFKKEEWFPYLADAETMLGGICEIGLL